MLDRLEFQDTYARPLVYEDLDALMELTSYRPDLPDGPKTPEWLKKRNERSHWILKDSPENDEIIGTFRNGELIAMVDMAYLKTIPMWHNPYLEAKYPSSNSLSRDLIHNGIAVSLNLACHRAESRNYFTWYWIRTVRDTILFNAMLKRTKFSENTSEKHYYPGRGRYNFYTETVIKAGELPVHAHQQSLLVTPMRVDCVVSFGSLIPELRLQYLGLDRKASGK